MSEKLSMMDIANELGLSTATISRVINNKGGYSKNTEEKVLEYIKDKGYTPNNSAKCLRTNQSSIIGIIVPDITNEFFAKIIRVINNFFLQYKYSIFICDSNEDGEREEKHMIELIEKNVDGIIYISGQTEVRSISEKHSIPIVYIDRRPDKAEILIQSDNEMGGYLATKELIDKGCKRIVLLRDERAVSPIRNRRKGYLRALKEHDINYMAELEVLTTPYYESAKDKMTDFYRTKIEFDGIFATNDMMALGSIHSMEELGLKVPMDVKVVGFDNISISSFSNPPITTIAQDMDKLGELAAETLLKLLNKETIQEKNITVPVVLNVRKSTYR
ncbi:substrate-binding domain-containing protein [Alkalibaculum sp. M08DMB]|uniref:Substrate-binding domain-containing protein n=1 Tax=Alkalibaculum sporogenes TaxID=2655001 RepID=A0A6A7K4W6_9FIRM|nr:LacI family DNA-binding transcriptional regulator [Alkalibaculum sporogenes]MPW24421.1 substrate-binding domain-containing protein [Alkalibaculum sporogenes]